MSASIQSEETKKWISEKLKEKKEKKKQGSQWDKNGDLENSRLLPFPNANYVRYENMSMVEIFEQFIDDEVIQLIVEETRRYAMFLNCPDPGISSDEIRCFIGILFISGYNNLPSKRHYWSSSNDLKNYAVSESMRQSRFLQICRFLHLEDNTKINQQDKAWKIRPLMELLKERCIRNFQPEEQLSYDESMVKYFGKHSCKQFIRGKPIRFGYKMWCLNTKEGYLINFELYQGQSSKSNTDYGLLFGKASAPLLVLLDELPESKRNLRYHIHMDNLFSGPNLFSYLKFHGYFAIGTIRDNRIPANCPITSKKTFGRENRGYFEKSLDKNDGLLYIRWMDNAVVSMISSSYGTQPVNHVKRYSQKDKRHIYIPIPQVIAQYNKYMGGTDQMDQNVACYRIGIRGKKWYWPIVTWLLDMSLQNSWILYNKIKKEKISQLDFKREVANAYIIKYGTASKGAGRPSTSCASSADSRISNEIRFDRIDHLVKRTEDNKKRRCAKRTCSSIVRTMCSKCKIALCLDCFASFHQR